MRNSMIGALLALSLAGCSGGQTLHVYNHTGEDVTVTIGSESNKVPADLSQVNLSAKLAKGTVIRAVGSRGLKEDVSVHSAGGDFLYNVGGKADLVLVDFSGCYTKEGEQPTGPPFKVVEDLAGKKLTALPAGTLVDANQAFPHEVLGDAKVFRIEPVPKEFRNHGIDAYVAKSLQTEIKMRGHLYRK